MSSRSLSPPLEDGVEVDPSVFHATNQSEDIALVRNMGFVVSDDNEPAEENVPSADSPTASTNEGLYPNQKWGWEGIDRRRIVTPTDQVPGWHGDFAPKSASLLNFFLHLFPLDWLKNVVIVKTSEALEAQGKPAVTFGEFLRYIGLWLLMATLSGWSRDDSWSVDAFDQRSNACPFNFRGFMRKTRFNDITQELRFTDDDKPSFADKFWEVRQMIREWNKNVAAIFISS